MISTTINVDIDDIPVGRGRGCLHGAVTYQYIPGQPATGRCPSDPAEVRPTFIAVDFDLVESKGGFIPLYCIQDYDLLMEIAGSGAVAILEGEALEKGGSWLSP